jgi:hypothetical protein
MQSALPTFSKHVLLISSSFGLSSSSHKVVEIGDWCKQAPSFVDLDHGRPPEEGGVEGGHGRNPVRVHVREKLGLSENDAPTVYVAICCCLA